MNRNTAFGKGVFHHLNLFTQFERFSAAGIRKVERALQH